MNTIPMRHKMKKLAITGLLLLSLFVFGRSLRAQDSLGFGISGFIGMPDTVYSGAQMPIGAYIVNHSALYTYIDSIRIDGYIDTGSAVVPVSFPAFYDSIAPGDSLFGVMVVDFRDTFMGGSFKIGGNVIVVWPASYNSLFGTGDSLVATVFVLDSINGVHNPNPPDQDVRCYPVPAQGLLYIASTNPSYRVKEAAVHDMTGRIVATSTNTSAGINTETWPAGIYILEVTFDNGTKRIYKISRK